MKLHQRSTEFHSQMHKLVAFKFKLKTPQQQPRTSVMVCDCPLLRTSMTLELMTFIRGLIRHTTGCRAADECWSLYCEQRLNEKHAAEIDSHLSSERFKEKSMEETMHQELNSKRTRTSKMTESRLMQVKIKMEAIYYKKKSNKWR